MCHNVVVGERHNEFREPNQVVGGGRQGEGPSDFLDSSIFRLSEAADGLHPAEAFLDPLANALADRLAGMARGGPVDGGATAGVSRDVRGHVDLA